MEMVMEPRDRSSAIRVLGVIQIVLGGLTALLALIGVAMLGMAARMPGSGGPTAGMTVFFALFYLVPAANLLTTGIGSVRFSPWARLATIISAGIWLGIGSLLMLMMLVSAFAVHAQVGGAEAMVMVTIFFPILLGLPVTLLMLYTRPGVRETFARRHAERG
jgi:hypothetical protein